MTAKRFTLIECNGNIEDGCTQIVYDGGEDVFILLDLLNSLNDENEELKQLIKETLEITPMEHSLAVKLKNSIREMYE